MGSYKLSVASQRLFVAGVYHTVFYHQSLQAIKQEVEHEAVSEVKFPEVAASWL